MKRFLQCSALAAISVFAANKLFAHGGGHPIPHQGPAGSVTTNPFQGQPTTPTTPTTPNPTNPTTPTAPTSPNAPPTPTPAPTSGASAPTRPTAAAGAGPAVTRRNRGTGGRSYEDWNFWWHFNKEPFLELKTNLYKKGGESESSAFFLGRKTKDASTDTARPSAAFIRANLIPKLVEALEDGHPDVVDSACVALGKVGSTAEVPILVKMLRHKNQSVRKSAVIGLGLLEVNEAVPPLLAILESKGEGTKLRGGREPEFGMRAMAGTSLGLVQGYNATDEGNKVRDALIAMSKSDENKNIRVNSAVALGLLKGDKAYLDVVINHLKTVATKQRYDDFVRAHSVIALGRLMHRNEMQIGQDTVDWLEARIKRARTDHVRRSAIITLGTLLAGQGEKYPSVIKTLRLYVKGKGKGGGNMSRNWAAIAMGQIGGPTASKTLRDVALSEKNQKGAFAALGLGILVDAMGKEQASDERAKNLSALRSAFKKQKNPRIKSGFAIALGIARDHESGEALLQAMKKSQDVDLRGYLAIAMGMINYATAVDYLTAVLEAADNLPFLKEQTAIALGLMGTRQVTGKLLMSLEEGKSAYVQSSVTKALGYIGDRETIGPLVKFLSDKGQQDLTRAFSCVALGSIGDDKDIPVLSGLFTNHNYFASTQSLMELSRIL